MNIHKKEIAPLLDYIKIDRFYVSCYFRCKVTNKTVISTVPLEPYNGKVELDWKDILLHPLKSYHQYYHTPISIYNNECNETIVLKAFHKVSNYFVWNQREKKYIHN